MATNFKFTASNGAIVDFSDTFVPISQFLVQSLYSWGGNGIGQLGVNDLVSRSTPAQVGSLTNWSTISCGYNPVVIKTDGTMWTWGNDSYGQLGQGTLNVNKSSPIQIGTDNNWSQISAGNSSVLALKSNGTLWAWGRNFFGNLGLGDIDPRSVPTQVGTDTNWSQIVNTGTSTFAIKNNGTLWSWGNNTSGQLGQNDINNRSSPVQVGSLTNWKSLYTTGVYNSAHVAVATTSNDIYIWGANGAGQLGLGDVISRSSPVLLPTQWATLSTGAASTVFIKSDGTMWSCGNDTNGQLGLGTNGTNRSSPVQIGTANNWKYPVAAPQNSAAAGALRTDGTLWMWGYNASGQLGQGVVTNRLSPVQTGTASNWATFAIALSSTHGIQSVS